MNIALKGKIVPLTWASRIELASLQGLVTLVDTHAGFACTVPGATR